MSGDVGPGPTRYPGRMDLHFVLRRIALGLPLVVLPVGAGVLITSTGCLCGSCPPGELRTRSLTSTERRALETDTSGLVCGELCDATDDAGVGALDAGDADGGPYRSRRGWVCSVDGTTLHCNEHIGCGVGRAPQGLLPRGACDAPTPLAAHLAEAAHLEAAAVPAFEELARELALHGAHRGLVAWARRSAEEEVLHARATAHLARRRGAEVPPVVRRPSEPRSLAEVAEDNAFEGCVREAFGAVIAAHQAAHARDAGLRTTMGAIARDEARHALLSLELDAWAADRLPGSVARRVREARRAGALAVARSFASEPEPSVRRLAGVPSASVAQDLLTWFDAAA